MAILERVSANSELEVSEIKKSLRNKYGKSIDITVEIRSSNSSSVEHCWRETSNYISDKSFKQITVFAEDDSPEPEPKPQKSLEELFAAIRFKKTSTAR